MGLCVMYICTDVMGHREALNLPTFLADIYSSIHVLARYRNVDAVLSLVLPLFFFANVYQNVVAMW